MIEREMKPSPQTYAPFRDLSNPKKCGWLQTTRRKIKDFGRKGHGGGSAARSPCRGGEEISRD